MGPRFENVGLGFIAGKNSLAPDRLDPRAWPSTPVAWWPASPMLGGRSLSMTRRWSYAGDVDGAGVILGISDDRVKVGINNDGVVWEADNQTRRTVEDPAGNGTLLFAISPDHSRLLGSSNVLGDGSTSPEKLTWWTYDGVATLVRGRAVTSSTGASRAARMRTWATTSRRRPMTSPGDLLHIESTNQTLRIVDWFESLSGVELPAETSDDRPADRLRLRQRTGGDHLGRLPVHGEDLGRQSASRGARGRLLNAGRCGAGPWTLQACWRTTPTTRAARCTPCWSPGLRMAAWNSTTTAASLTPLNRIQSRGCVHVQGERWGLRQRRGDCQDHHRHSVPLAQRIDAV